MLKGLMSALLFLVVSVGAHAAQTLYTVGGPGTSFGFNVNSCPPRLSHKSDPYNCTNVGTFYTVGEVDNLVNSRVSSMESGLTNLRADNIQRIDNALNATLKEIKNISSSVLTKEAKETIEQSIILKMEKRIAELEERIKELERR